MRLTTPGKSKAGAFSEVFVQLIYDSIRAGAAEAAGFENCLALFPAFLVNERSVTQPQAWLGPGGVHRLSMVFLPISCPYSPPIHTRPLPVLALCMSLPSPILALWPCNEELLPFAVVGSWCGVQEWVVERGRRGMGGSVGQDVGAGEAPLIPQDAHLGPHRPRLQLYTGKSTSRSQEQRTVESCTV